MRKNFLNSRASIAAGTALALLLFFVAITSGQQTWTPARKGSYGKITRNALDRLLESAKKLHAGDTAGAGALLQGMRGDVGDLSTATGFFREQANREFGRCVDHIGTLDTRVAELVQEEAQVKATLQELDARLTGLNLRKQMTEDQVASLNKSVKATQTKLVERQKKLQELEKWWWVPFYGAYLGIRTLVDDDIGNYNSLRNTLNDASIQLTQHRQELQALNVMKTGLTSEMQVMARTHEGLRRMRTESEVNLGSLKNAAVFLTDAAVFWGKMDSLLRLNVSQSVTTATDILGLQTMVTRESSPPLFNSIQKRPLLELYESLVAFADTLDQGNNFLLAEGSEFCGGPARPRAGPNVSSACDIERFTTYYEIVDPKTCSFRYLNPPGCPPRPKAVTVTDQAGAARRGAWVQAPGENWIGRARCASPDVMYYGKMNASADCERACKSDGTCVAWTYNDKNVYMPGSRQECWGGTAKLGITRQSWSGFESGGIQAR